MKRFLLGLILISSQSFAQVETPLSVYSCAVYPTPPTQTEVLTFPVTTFARGCVELTDAGNYNFNDATYASNNITNGKNIQSATSIHADPTCHVGPFTGAKSMRWSIAPQSPFDVAVMNYDALTGIEKLKKFELGIQMPNDVLTKINNFISSPGVGPTKLNPFLDWELDVEASFTKLGEETSKVIDGFYHRNYVRNNDNTDWNDLGTLYPFRIRFAPPNTGAYSCVIRIKVSGSTAYTSAPFTFNVIETGAHGYTKVHDNDRNLEVDGEIIIPIGHNFPYPVISTHAYDVLPNNTTKAAPPVAWDIYLGQLRDYHDLGGNYVRISQGASASLIEFEEKGNYYDRLHYAWETDHYIEYCEENGVMLNFNLMFQEPMFKYGQYAMAIWDFCKYDWDGTNHVFYPNDPYKTYCYNDDPTVEDGDTPDKMFTDESDLIYHEQRTRYYIARYGYSTSIMQFEFLSEAFHLGQKHPIASFEAENSTQGETLRLAVENYVERMSDYIKETLYHTEHLLGHHAFGRSVSKPDAGYYDYSLDHNNIDVIGYSTYDEFPWKYIKTKSDDGIDIDLDTHPEESYFRYTRNLNNLSGKPIMHYEEGALFSNDPDGGRPDECSDNSVHKINVASVGFTGCAGFFVWDGFTDINSELWPMTIAAEHWMNSVFVKNLLESYNGEWNQGRQTEENIISETSNPADIKENQYYIDLAQEKAVGYVHNRTYNYFTQRNGVSLCNSYSADSFDGYLDATNVDWQDGHNLRIKGLQSNTDYLVKWYDRMGNSIGEECYSTGLDNDLKLKHPDLIVEENDDSENVPLIWYTAEKHNCQEGISQNSQAPSEKPSNVRILADDPVSHEIAVFPNPFTDEITLVATENSKFFVYDSKNQLVYQGWLEKGANKIDLHSISQGLYLLKVDFSGETFKLIKQ